MGVKCLRKPWDSRQEERKEQQMMKAYARELKEQALAKRKVRAVLIATCALLELLLFISRDSQSSSACLIHS